MIERNTCFRIKFMLKMATSTEKTPLSQYKCHGCNVIPTEEQVIKCSQGHVMCLNCFERNANCKVRISNNKKKYVCRVFSHFVFTC